MIWIFVSLGLILLLGIIHILYDIRSIESKQGLIKLYVEAATRLVEQQKVNKDNSFEVRKILTYSDDVSDFMDESIGDAPSIDLANSIKNQRYYQIENIVHRLVCNYPKAKDKLDRTKSQLKYYLLNPFIWFYKGIEVFSLIILGYFINNGTIDYPGKVWNVFNILFSIVTGCATLVSLALQLLNK